MADSGAWDQGWALGNQIQQKRADHKQAIADMELTNKAQAYATQLTDLQKKISALPKDSPEYQQTFSAMQDTMKGVRELFHPQTNPGLIEKAGHLITDALKLTSPSQRQAAQATKQAAGNAQDAKMTQGMVAAAPPSPEEQAARQYTAQMNAQLGVIDNLKIPEDQKQKYRDALFKVYQKSNNKVYKAPDGTIYSADINDPDSFIPGSVPYANPTVGNEIMDEFKQAQAAGYTGGILQFRADSVKSKAMQAEWTRAHYGGRDMDQLSPEEADQAMAKYQEEKSPLLTSTGQGLVYDTNNQPHVFTHTSTSRKTYPGANGASPTPPTAPISPKTPVQNGTTPSNGAPAPAVTLAELRNKAAKLNNRAPIAPKSPIGPALDFTRATPATAAADKDVNTAVGLADAAHRAENAPMDVRAGLQRAVAAGIQNALEKRFNQAAFDNLIKHYGVANDFQAWLEHNETGALPDTIFKQLVAIADSNVTAKKAAQTQSRGGNTSGTTPQGGETKEFHDNGKIYDIPADKVEAFKKKHPNAKEQ